MLPPHCPNCQAEIPAGAETCSACGARLDETRVNVVPAMAGAALFISVLLVCEWIHLFWPVTVVGALYLVFLVFQYGKLAFVATPDPPPEIKTEVPVGQLLEKIEPAEQEQTCPECGTQRVEGVKFCGNCGHAF